MVAVFSIALLLTSFPSIVKSQGPPPPPADEEQGGGHGSNNNEPPPDGGSAPLGSGVGILIAMAAGYGIWKYRKSGKAE